MGGGSPSSPSGSSTSSTNSQLYNWYNILPPWVQSGQQTALPWLMSRAESGLLPGEERALWGPMQEQLATGSDLAGKNLTRQLASSGMNPSSPMVAGALSDLASDRMTQTSKAALDFAKMKMGAKDTAIGQMLTALYTPPPVAVGQNSYTVQRQQGGGGGK